MRSSARLIGLLVVLPLAACSSRPTLSPIAPERYAAAGDTARFGPGPIALDAQGRLVQVDLRVAASVVTFVLSRSWVRMMDVRYLPAGRHTIPPWSNRYPDMSGGGYSPGQQALLIVVAEEDWRFGIPGHMPPTVVTPFSSGGEESVPYDTRNPGLTPAYALTNLAPTMLRQASSPWAAYLIAAESWE